MKTIHLSFLAALAAGMIASSPLLAETVTLTLPDRITCSVTQTPCDAANQVITQRIDTLSISLKPSAGVIRGPGGSTIGLGFEVQWNSATGDYLRFDSAGPGRVPSVAFAWNDFIGFHGGPSLSRMAPNTTWTEDFDVATVKGAGAFLLLPDCNLVRAGTTCATGGAADSGNIVFNFSVYDGDPVAGGKYIGSYNYGICTDSDLSVCAAGPTPYTAEVDVTSSSTSAVLTFDSPGDKTMGAAAFPVTATSSDGATVVLSSNTPGTCTVSNFMVSLVSAGTCALTAGHPFDTSIQSITQTFRVYAGVPTITWNKPTAITFGSALGNGQLSATVNAPGTLTYSLSAGTVLPVGTEQLLSVTFTSSNPGAWTDAATSRTIDVNAAAQTVTPASLTSTWTLSRANGVISIRVTLANTGGTAANSVVLTSVKIGSTTAAPAGIVIGSIAGGSTASTTVTVPGTAGTAGTASTITIAGTFAGGTFSASGRITLP